MFGNPGRIPVGASPLWVQFSQLLDWHHPSKLVIGCPHREGLLIIACQGGGEFAWAKIIFSSFSVCFPGSHFRCWPWWCTNWHYPMLKDSKFWSSWVRKPNIAYKREDLTFRGWISSHPRNLPLSQSEIGENGFGHNLTVIGQSQEESEAEGFNWPSSLQDEGVIPISSFREGVIVQW